MIVWIVRSYWHYISVNRIVATSNMRWAIATILLTWFQSNLVQCLMKFTPVLELPQGRIRGYETQKGDYRKYLGIPYATVVERFMDPGAAPLWDDVFNATKDRVACSQYHQRLGLPTGKEDCLILNVYTPGQVSFKNPLPVMFFIHGGGYTWGRSSNFIYNPEPLVKKNVIVVTINYRLGAFGFLCLKIKGAPGNAGLKDQLAALLWVRQNIRFFGGDPNSVTIFGESAGSSSVSHLILSRDTRGLFRRAIMESGTALSPFAFSYDPIEKAAWVASKLGYNTKNPYELLSIFKNATAGDIIMASIGDGKNPLSSYLYRPCAEKQVFGSKPFLTKSPKQILESGNYNKVPVILGYNDKEGIFYVGKYDDASLLELNDDFESLLPDNLYFSSPEQKTAVANEIKFFYFGENNIDKDTLENLIDYFSDVLYHYPAETVTEYHLQSTKLPIYNYYFQYDSYRNLGKILSGGKDRKGAAHTDELFYMFQPIVLWPLPRVKKDVAVIDKMTSLWTTFAKTGDPTGIPNPAVTLKWEPSDNGTLNFLTIDKYLSMGPLPNPRRIDFWRYIYYNYGAAREYSN